MALNIKGTVEDFKRLGRQIKISPKSRVAIGQGTSFEIEGDSVVVTIGIGSNHVAHLLMTYDAWIALHQGQAITTKQYER